jgi:glycine cleavage system transcriptional repressor
MSAIGEDRAGIVADLAELIYECDCNLEDSRMTLLGTEFAVLLLASGRGPDVEPRLTAGCKRLEWEKRLTVFLRVVDGAAPSREDAETLVCEVTGIDKAGIVARVTRTLADQGINVTDLRSHVLPASGSGTPIYTLRIAMAVPPGTSLARLRADLEAVAEDLGVDLSIENAPPA